MLIEGNYGFIFRRSAEDSCQQDLHMKNPADPDGSAGALGRIIPYIPDY